MFITVYVLVQVQVVHRKKNCVAPVQTLVVRRLPYTGKTYIRVVHFERSIVREIKKYQKKWKMVPKKYLENFHMTMK